jgi:peptidoglycan hydrolase-like protein with peptidoglycan-binding domain
MNCENINLKRGSKGDTVKELQTILKEKKLYNGKIDGDYGPLTETAVKKLQKQQGNTPDGWFGPKTCKKLQQQNSNKKESQKTQNSTKTIQKTKLITRLEKATRTTITDYKTLYKAFKNVKYSYYNNDIYTLTEEITRIEKGEGLNCTDQAQIAMKALIDLGYPTSKIRIVRGVVTCKSGKGFGHVWLQINLGRGWINYDPSAISAHGYKLGQLICTKGYQITNINPAWAVTDDGRT